MYYFLKEWKESTFKSFKNFHLLLKAFEIDETGEVFQNYVKTFN